MLEYFRDGNGKMKGSDTYGTASNQMGEISLSGDVCINGF
jgi:hypothetical protein